MHWVYAVSVHVHSQVLEATPPEAISLVTRSIAPHHLARLLSSLAEFSRVTPHLEFYMLWIQHLMIMHGATLRKEANRYSHAAA